MDGLLNFCLIAIIAVIAVPFLLMVHRDNQWMAEEMRRMDTYLERMLRGDISSEEMLRHILGDEAYEHWNQARPSEPGRRGSRAWYEILGISPQASLSEIKAAYRAIAKRTHPDSAGTNADVETFAEATKAYEAAIRSRG